MCDEFIEDVPEDFVAEVNRGSHALQIVIGVAQQGEVRAVLLEVVTAGIDDGDRFFRMREDLTIEIVVQLNRTSGWRSGNFSTRISLLRHRMPTGKLQLAGDWAGRVDINTFSHAAARRRYERLLKGGGCFVVFRSAAAPPREKSFIKLPGL